MSPRHSWTAAATSAVIHSVVLVSAVSAVREVAPAIYPRVGRPLTFIHVVPAPDPAVVVAIEPFRAPEPVPAVEAEPALAPLVPEPAPTPAPRPAPVTAMARRVEPVRASEPTPVPTPVPSPPAHAFEPPKPVQMAGFDAPAARVAPIEIKRAMVGAFDTAPASARPQPGSDRPNVVADAGFGAAMATPGSPAPARQVADAGFGAAASVAAARPSAAVKPTDFDAQEPSRPAAPATRPVRIDEPVEVLNKPTPEYTDEARAKKIEGDVVLEVEFTAAGDIHVLRVVRGLGHGLDEAATRAALGMRFKPARSGGRPVDFRTTVHIVFRLA